MGTWIHGSGGPTIIDMLRCWWHSLFALAALGCGCGGRTGLLFDSAGGDGEGDAGRPWQAMRWVLTDSGYEVLDSPVGLVELSASGELRYEEKLVLGTYERVVGVDARHVFVDSYVPEREPESFLRILSTSDLSELAVVPDLGYVDCIIPRREDLVVAFGRGVYLLNPDTASLVREVDTTVVPGFHSCWACAATGGVAATLAHFELSGDARMALLLFDLESESLLDAVPASPGVDLFRTVLGSDIHMPPSPHKRKRLIGQGSQIYVLRRYEGEDAALERFDLDRLASDGIILSSYPGGFLVPDPVILGNGEWLTGMDYRLARVVPDTGVTETLSDAWADALGALAVVEPGVFLSVGRLEDGAMEMAISLRDDATAETLTSIPFDGRPYVTTFLTLWPIPGPESRGP